MHAVQLYTLCCSVIFLNSFYYGLSCEFFCSGSTRLSLRWLENWVGKDGKVILIFDPLVLVLVTVVMDVEAEAFFLCIFPIDARLSVAFVIGWIRVGLMGGSI